jgi:hypothetical protein
MTETMMIKIKMLKAAARLAGDRHMVADCLAALGGDYLALDRCEDAIEDDQAMGDEDSPEYWGGTPEPEPEDE